MIGHSCSLSPNVLILYLNFRSCYSTRRTCQLANSLTRPTRTSCDLGGPTRPTSDIHVMNDTHQIVATRLQLLSTLACAGRALVWSWLTGLSIVYWPKKIKLFIWFILLVVCCLMNKLFTPSHISRYLSCSICSLSAVFICDIIQRYYL